MQRKYHIDSITRHYNIPKWEGDDFVTTEYLVPNDLKIPEVITKQYIENSGADGEIVMCFKKVQIQETIKDMQNSKYSTRVSLKTTKRIIDICNKRMHTKSLNKIVPFLQDIVDKYNNYKWNPESVAEYRIKEEQIIRDNESRIAEIVSQSIEIEFKKEDKQLYALKQI